MDAGRGGAMRRGRSGAAARLGHGREASGGDAARALRGDVGEGWYGRRGYKEEKLIYGGPHEMDKER